LAHAAGDISGTLIRTCSNQLNGAAYGDAVLNDLRSAKFPSPRTGGFKITSVEQVWLALPSYCLIKGTIQPVSPGGIDPAVKAPDYRVPDINYQVYIPSQWNGKFVQLGGGGSGANYDGYNRLLDALAPVWNVKPGDLGDFFDAAASQKRAGKKGKKIIIYQGTSDFLVPCTQAGEFVSQLTRKAAAGEIKNSVRTYFIEDYSHGFYSTNSLLKRIGLSAMQLNWNAVSDLDQWVHDDNAGAGAPLLARNASGAIPANQALSAWGCLAAD
jgi:hypothetical protein